MHKEWQTFLEELGAKIDDDRTINFDPPQFDINNTPVVTPVSGFTLLAVEGEDRHTFLHSQFVNDLNLVEQPASQFSAWCNPKGQVITTFLIINTGTSYLLFFKQDLNDFVQKRLGMFVLRSDVTIKDISEDTPVIGIANNPDLSNTGLEISTTPGAVTAREGLIIINLPDKSKRQLIISNIETQRKTLQALKTGLTLTGSQTWELLDILAGLPWLTTKTKEEFLPQMLNLDLLDALSYKKGCYPGQEVIARLHFRGNVKKRVQLIKSEHTLYIGDTVSAEETNVGIIINAAKHPEEYFLALAVINLEMLNEGLFVNREPVALLQPPYAASD